MFPWSSRKPLLISFLTVMVSAPILGCSQNMDDQPRYKTYAADPLTYSGTSARPIPEGTVPREAASVHDSTKYDPAYTTGFQDGQGLTNLPAQLLANRSLKEVVIRGQARFAIYCAPCHGLSGYGDGMVPRRGFPYPPNYHTDDIRSLSVGQIYGVITNGFGRMPSYRAQIPTDDRWAIAAYVRTLQLSQYAPVDQLTPAERRQLDATRTTLASPSAGGK